MNGNFNLKNTCAILLSALLFLMSAFIIKNIFFIKQLQTEPRTTKKQPLVTKPSYTPSAFNDLIKDDTYVEQGHAAHNNDPGKSKENVVINNEIDQKFAEALDLVPPKPTKSKKNTLLDSEVRIM